MVKRDDAIIERIVFSDRIDRNSVGNTIRELINLDSIHEVDRIELLINTSGGCVTSGLALIDTILALNTPVDTIASGACMSMGIYILQAGEYRFATPNTSLMIHPIKCDPEGSTDEIQRVLTNWKKLEQRCLKFASERIGMPVSELRELRSIDYYMSPLQAKKLGFIDAILRPLKR